jgi:large subunit ribosomal protein L10e
MAKLRKWCAYRTIERPYTRFSKYRKKAFVKARPGKRVIKHDMGDVKGGTSQFPLSLKLVSKEVTSVRANAIEAARITSLKKLEGKLGRFGFYFRIKIHAHHAIRENPLAAGAGADRLSTGMKHSFGKIIGMAARIEAGKTLMEIHVPKEEEAIARLALKSASKKLPIRTTIQTEVHKVVEFTEEQHLAQHLAEARDNLKVANEDLTVLNKHLVQAESEEDKKKAQSEIDALTAKIKGLEHIVEVKKGESDVYQEEHSSDK